MKLIFSIESWLAIAVAKLLLRLAPAATLRSLAMREQGADGELTESTARIVDAFSIVASASALRPQCLERAVALQMLLLGAGLRPKLRLGLGREHRFPGHAWLELNRQPVGERTEVVARFDTIQFNPEGLALAIRGR